MIVLPFNMFGGAAGLVLNIRAQQQGFPGTGHLLNWIYLMSTVWLFLIAIVLVLSDIAIFS
jgi:hypothetical protein